MIPDIAVIVSAYAVARLVNEYVLTGDGAAPLRFFVGIAAVGVIGLFLVSVLSSASELSNL